MARINEIYNKPLRDPIHDYINLTPIEQTIIDTPVFQRLRYILQNSSAYLTYPNNNTTRFMHSLGVMNIGGKYFVRSLENAHTNVLVKYLSIVDKVFSKYEDNLEIKPDVFQKEWLDMVGNASKFNHHPKGDGCFKSIQKIDGNYKYEIGSPKKRLKHDPLFLINTLWQAVRLCALIHDIGHLPMSHIFEKAISSFLADYPETQVKDFYEKELKSKENEFLEILDDPLKAEFDTAYSLPLHELRGLYIFKHIYPDPDKHYNKLVFKIAKSIYLYSDKLYDAVVRDLNKNEQVLNCLHNIISSEVDCDRLDYCVRDPHASGLELGAVDVHRIVDNMILYIREDGNFHISPTAKSQSAIESFFHQRYLEYKYLIYHHNVLRMDGIFQKILIMLFEEITKEKNKSRVIINILDEFSFYLKDPGPKKYRFLS